MSSQLSDAFPESWILRSATLFECQAFQGPEETIAKEITVSRKHFGSVLSLTFRDFPRGSN